MWAENLKKITSFFLIFFLLFSFTFRIPLEIFIGSRAYAGDKDFFNLVSIIVDEDTYEDIKGKLVRYSRDIQGQLENTKVVILPTPSSASVLDIASLNESLYFEGYKSLENVDYESRLIGTILIGNLPVPVVFDGSLSGKSLLPYIDFEDKAFIFNHESEKYEKNDVSDARFTPEIWHGVISPNTGAKNSDVDAIVDYLDKNHDFYTGQGVFDQNIGVIDGTDAQEPDSYDPYVFYYDQFRENEALQYQNYIGYEMYLQNIEDITYNRYSKELAEKVKDQVLGVQNADIYDLLSRVDPDFDVSAYGDTGPDASSSSDILTRYITDNSTKNFLEVFNGSTLGEMRKYVFNAGRYNEGGSKVNMDMPPFLIGVLDAVSSEVIKNVNTSLESDITDLVANGLSRKIAIPLEDIRKSESTSTCDSNYRGFFYGTIANEISSASQCSIYRGNTNSGTLVEANRGFNINLTQADNALCQGDYIQSDTDASIVSKGYWGGNSPLNFDLAGIESFADFSLKNNNLKGAIRPVFDILGSKQIYDESKNPSPLDCFNDGVMIKTYQEAVRRSCSGSGDNRECEDVCSGVLFQAPVLGKSRQGSWSCRTNNVESGFGNFEEDYASISNGTTTVPDNSVCVKSNFVLDGNILKSQNQSCTGGGDDGCSCTTVSKNLTYKSIDSYILHTSPTDQEFGAQIGSLFTPSLPIDTDRYIDFIGAKGGNSPDYGYERIDFPQLFRVQFGVGEAITLENAAIKVEQYLDAVSNQINAVIRSADPSGLTGDALSIYNILKTGDYPQDNFDLHQMLQDKPLEVFSSNNQSKEISYFDTLVFAVFWNNLDSVSSKYKFIFENYLSNQFEGNDYNFHLPKVKNSYEVGYLAAPGDAQNMYIKLDPERKNNHPYADILSQNLALNTTLAATSVSESTYEEPTFECAPPDGVNIFQWIPAVICWLKTMLPPTIKIGTNSCGAEPFTQEQLEEIAECSVDQNANGIIDCLEEKLIDGSLLLYSDQGRYYYHTPGMIRSEIYDSDDELAFFDSNSYVEHTLTRLEIPGDSEIEFTDSNVQVVYDINDSSKNSEEDYKNAQKYLSFQASAPRAFRGVATTYFYGRGEDVNAYFQSNLVIDDYTGKRVVDLTSNTLRVEVRGDRMLIGSFKIENAGGEYYAGSSLTVAGDDNICLVDANAGSLGELADEAYALSNAPEKLLLSVQNVTQNGNTLPISYPLDIQLVKDGKTYYEQQNIGKTELSSVIGLFQARESGLYELIVTDNNGFTAKKRIDLYADSAQDLEIALGSNILESGGNISTHFVSIFDAFGNLANSDISILSAEIQGDSAVFAENNAKKIEYSLAEGYKAIRLKTTENTGNVALKFTLSTLGGELISEKLENIQVVDDIEVQVQALDGDPKVGGGNYRFELSFTDSTGKLYSTLSSRAYANIEKLYGVAPSSFVEVVGGKAEISFSTKTLAARNVFLEFQLEGGNEIYKKSIDILPDEAIKIDLRLSKDKIEASFDESTLLEATLKDRYNNDVFTNSTTKLFLEIPEKSQNILSTNSQEKIVSQGKAQFEISATDVPGTGYFRVYSEPDLSQTSFRIIGQAPFESDLLDISSMKDAAGNLTNTGKKFYKKYSETTFISLFSTEQNLTTSQAYGELSGTIKEEVLDLWRETNALEVFGLGENAGSVETFFFWNKKSIEGNAYNTLYSVMLGAPYGDISQENYLAGELLFDRDNSSLAVTSLLNNPYSFSDTLSIQPSGQISLENTRDLTQDIEMRADIDDEGRIFVDVYNDALDSYIGRVYYTLSSDENISVDFLDETYRYTESNTLFRIQDSVGQSIFEIDTAGKIKRKSGSFISISETSHTSTLDFILHHNGNEVAVISLDQKFETNITRDINILENKLEILKDTAVLYISSNSYSSREEYSTQQEKIITLYYHDPFATKNNLNRLHDSDGIGLEASYDEAGIGWQDPNLMLLSFASGESVGNATDNFQSFSLINLGDPVISLKPHREYFPGTNIEKSFDPTIGEIISDSADIIGYQVFDYNNDQRKDILTISKDGYASLLEGAEISNRFIHQKDLTFASDGGSPRFVKTGDFTGDGYADIFFVSNTGSPEIFNNHRKDFYRVQIEEQFSLSGAIIQAEVFDMDGDTKDDIITLDDAGEIHIFYGGGTSQNLSFTKKFIGNGYNVEIVSESESFGGAIYFDGLTQIDPNNTSQVTQLTNDYLEQVSQAIANEDPEGVPAPEFMNDSLIQSLLYVEIPYYPTDYELPEIDEAYVVGEFIQQTENLGPEAQNQGVGNASTVLDDFLNNYDEFITYSGYQNTRNINTYFLRSQYADTQGLEISKIFTDTTPPNLQTGDTIYYDITIKNTSSQIRENIAYVDVIPKYFAFKTDEYTIISNDDLEPIPRKSGVGNYNILLDGIYLIPGEEITVRYELETLPLSYGHMQVGLYEQGEIGDDIYGDIILKEDEKNCGREAKIYRSTAIRSYNEGMTVPVCDEDAVKIGNTFPELVDEDGNGIPDYIDNLLIEDINGNIVPTNDTDLLSDYAQEALTTLSQDTDSDGIPDSDDSMPNSDSALDFMGALDQINEAIDDIAGELDTLIEGFSCGFGGGSCFANPLNWAPLAPGNDPTLFGMPIGDGLRVNEGFPIFSALTGIPGPFCSEIPAVWPLSSSTFDGVCGGAPGAGGSLGVNSPTNFVRMFVTPTLTGGAGIAVCFGAPAIVAGNSIPMGVSPVVPGGNCIVAAMPLFGCEGGEGDPSGLGYPIIGDFGVIHANCDGNIGQELVSPQELSSDFVQNYFQYLETGDMPAGMYEQYISSFENIDEYGSSNFVLPSQPLINIGGGEGLMETSIDLDLSALSSANLSDVVQIQNKRIGGFPNFLMDWVERQLDEVTSKLTNLPKIYVILPDFGGIFDGSFENFGQNLQQLSDSSANERQQERAGDSNNIDGLRQARAALDCSGTDALECSRLSLQIASSQGQNFVTGTNERLSGIKEVYEFIGNIPLVHIETQQISVNVPWIDQSEIGRFIADWEFTAEEWKQELESASKKWSFGATCTGTDVEIASCQQQNDIRQNAYLEASNFIASLERNIEVLEEYKRFPEKLAKLINIKEVWLEQILCNIDAISKLMGEWISTNGERFKAWIELYILIKAILKSWQLFIDVFNGYDAECHECKNERQDLNNFVFKLISAVIPSPPIIEFPKWPDIILDFHNIRAGITIDMPEFKMNMRPIVLPTLPDLKLPDTPTAEFSLPELPVLPMFELPELPELPALPTVELPDLPPPPKIPKLFGPVEAVLNIAKLVTKVMCILKQSPFVPEWRAGDQIAFLTERNGYLPTDFIDIQMPAFSYSAVSAIKVTTYVNLEFETEFIVEAVRAITAPIDKITNNIANMFDLQISNLDFTQSVPQNIDINLNLDGTIETDVSFDSLDRNPEGIYVVAGYLASGMLSFLEKISHDEGEMMDNQEFISYMNHQLADTKIISDIKTEQLRNLWEEVQNISYSKQEKFIDDLAEHNKNKFQTLSDIISTEIEHTQQQQKGLHNISHPDSFILMDGEKDERITQYNNLLESYNISTIEAATALLTGESEEAISFREDLDTEAKNMMNEVRGGLQSYRNNLLAAETGSPSDVGGTCIGSGTYEYIYEGIYILEDGKNYKLFDYTDMLQGDEVPSVLDLDNDGDEDVLYLVDGKLFFKENRKQKSEGSYVSSLPIILGINDNKFYNGDIYYEAINGFKQGAVSDGAINIEFSRPTNPNLHNFRLTYNTIVDRYLDERDTFIPQDVQTHVVDALSHTQDIGAIVENSDYIIQAHIATLVYAGAMRDIRLTNERLINVKDELAANRQVNLTRGTYIYAGDTDFEIEYRFSQKEESKTVTVRKYTQLAFNKSAEIVSIRGDGYISLGILEDIEGTDVIDAIGKPLLLGAKIEFTGDVSNLDESSHVDIRYYDGSENLLDMRDIQSYVLYDLGQNRNETHTIRIPVENDFYYARIHSFSQEIISTLSEQILLSPQIYADTLAPQIGLNQKIRIPVYQKENIDLTNYIYEDGGISGISDIRVDFDLSLDSDGDGNSKNDRDTDKINIVQTPISVSIDFGPYETIFEKNILIALEDDNGNIATKEIGFEVYPPKPSIENIQENIISGAIDETLLDEPVRLYRYRGGVIEKLQDSDGNDVIETDANGNYIFETGESSDGLVLTYSGMTIAEINEYTGQILSSDILTSIKVLASNNPENQGVFPEIQVLRSGEPIFRQYIVMPEKEAEVVSNFNTLGEEEGIYVQLLNQNDYNIFRVPLGTPYNPGSLSVYRSDNTDKTPIMTLFKDGRVDISSARYELVYLNRDDNISLILRDKINGNNILQMLYKLDASYILN